MDQNLADSVSQTVDNARQSSLNLKAATARASDTITEFQRRDLIGRAQEVLDNSRQYDGAPKPSDHRFHEQPTKQRNSSYEPT